MRPPREDGSKAPVGEWKGAQAERPSTEQLTVWYGRSGSENTRTGLGIVTGNGIEAPDFDEPEVFHVFVQRCRELGAAELIDRVIAGYCETTPGGVHLLWRSEQTAGNLKLASKPCPGLPDCNKHEAGKPHVLIETRGNGGYIITAPSNGSVHPEGGAYELVSGGFSTIVTITAEERDLLLGIMRSFDEMPAADPVAVRGSAPTTGERPGDEFNRSATWHEVLEPHGWTLLKRIGHLDYWCRPGKQGPYVSATTGVRGGDPSADYLVVFSTSTDFETERGYSKFGAYALLNHRGDFSAAARQLRGPSVDLGELRSSPQTGNPPQAVDSDVARELHMLRVRDEARRLFAAEQRGNPPPPQILTLTERLAQPVPPTPFRIRGWMRRGRA